MPPIEQTRLQIHRVVVRQPCEEDSQRHLDPVVIQRVQQRQKQRDVVANLEQRAARGVCDSQEIVDHPDLDERPIPVPALCQIGHRVFEFITGNL
jgi:hypothetical protein